MMAGCCLLCCCGDMRFDGWFKRCESSAEVVNCLMVGVECGSLRRVCEGVVRFVCWVWRRGSVFMSVRLLFPANCVVVSGIECGSLVLYSVL